MPARSLKAAPDEALQGEIKNLKATVSSLDNANGSLSKQLGDANKQLAAYEQLKAAHKALEARLASSQAENGRLNADLNSARSGGARDSEIVSAAKQLAEAVKKLG